MASEPYLCHILLPPLNKIFTISGFELTIRIFRFKTNSNIPSVLFYAFNAFQIPKSINVFLTDSYCIFNFHLYKTSPFSQPRKAGEVIARGYCEME